MPAAVARALRVLGRTCLNCSFAAPPPPLPFPLPLALLYARCSEGLGSIQSRVGADS